MVEQSSEKRSSSRMGEQSPVKEKDHKENKSQPRSGKGFTYEVVLLDGEHVNIELDRNAEGKDLFEKVCEHLDLIEKEYFGLQYVDDRIPHPLKCWLSPDKKIAKQKKKGPWLFDFALKFYPPDPTQLRESLTRWLVTLQSRRDILYGRLPATFLTQAMLGSYNVQADVGDYDSTEHHGIDYVRDIPFAQNQTSELLEKIVELHRQHKGQTPDEAELNFLENVKKLSMYGVDMHSAQDVNNVDIMIGVCASGLQVYRDKLRISRFVWPKILKISYKRNHFYIKVRPADNSRLENSVSFKLPSHRLAKRLWKICVEHHAFFRLREADQPNNAAMFPRLGSKFRYSGRTLYQARHSTQNLDRPDPYFERAQPARNTYAAPSNRSRSVDELANRPDWHDDMDVERRPATLARDGRNRKDHMGQPTVISMLGLPEGMKPVESEEDGRQLEPGANRSMDGPDRLDRKPGDEDSTLEREGRPAGTMGLTPAELQKKAKEDDKEKKRREKEEEKRRKKEEEERKKAEKAAAKKGKGKGVEDRTDLVGGGDATETAPGHTPGYYADKEGDPIRIAVAAPVGSAHGEKDKEPGDTDPDVEMRERSAPRDTDPDKERFSTFKDPGGNERWSFKKDDPHSPSSPGKDRDGRSPGREKDRDGRSPGKDGDKFRFAPGKDGDRWSPEDGKYSPGKDGKDPYGKDQPDRDGRYRDPYAPGAYDGRDPYGKDHPDRDGKYRDPYGPGTYDGRDPYGTDQPDKDGKYGDPYGKDQPDRDGKYRDPYAPGAYDGRDPYGKDQPDRDGRYRDPYGKDQPDRDGRYRDPYAPGTYDREPYSGRDGRLEPGREFGGPNDPYREGGRPGEDRGRNMPPGSDREDGRHPIPEDDIFNADKVRWAPGVVPIESDRNQGKDNDKDDKKKKGRKDSDEDKKDKKKGKKGKEDGDKDKKKDKEDKKPGLFGKFKKPKDSKSKVPDDQDGSRPDINRDPAKQPPPGSHEKDKEKSKRAALIASLCPGQSPNRKGTRKSSASSEEGAFDPTHRESRPPAKSPEAESQPQLGGAYPGYGPGVGMGGAGDMSGVMGEETWIDNKMTFEPIVPPKKESRQSLKSPHFSDIDHTMPFFSPAATSTVGRPRSGKIPPPISPKPNNTSFDDSFSRRDYKTEKDGVQETRVEHKVVLSSTDDDFDYDAALAEAIRSVTEFSPDMSVERIECVQQIEDVTDK